MIQKVIYALGFFDGVHLGHAALLMACRSLAQKHNCRAGVVTFSGHPDGLVLGKAPGLINTEQDRELLLRQHYGMEEVVTIPFDRHLMSMPWDRFATLLLEKYNAGGFVCGHDFRFGQGGTGNGEKLTEFCRLHRIPCAVVQEQTVDGVTVSSTYIRTLLEEGNVERANLFLGHPHILTGTVVPGKQLGRTIGIPTANLLLPPGLLVPKFGVYACSVTIDGIPHAAVTNIGTRPTVSGEGITVEAWILDFSGDLYGRALTFSFHAFLRPEIKFPNLEALQAEIQKNAVKVREIFEKT